MNLNDQSIDISMSQGMGISEGEHQSESQLSDCVPELDWPIIHIHIHFVKAL